MQKHLYNESQYVYKGGLLHLRLDPLKKNGKNQEIVEHPPAVAVLPIYDENTFILIKQYRRAADQCLIEIPAGIIEENEKPIDCALREMQEEIGFSAHDIQPMGGFFLSPGFCTEYLHVFFAKDLFKSSKKCDEDEEIEVLFVSIPETLEMIKKNQIQDSKTITAVLQYQSMR